MKAPPAFWNDRHGDGQLAACLLTPFAWCYTAMAHCRHALARTYRAPRPVICVGNATLGGVGKTPFALMLNDILREKGQMCHFLTRGYGGHMRGPLQVDLDEHDCAAVGDEALMLARRAPVWVAKNRAAAAAQACSASAPDILVMDDGLQNPTLHKDISFLLVDTVAGFGNHRIFPAGPLRERPEEAMIRSDAVIFVKPSPQAQIPTSLRDLAKGKPSFDVWLKPLQPVASQGNRVVAFCGIGRPEKFFYTATQCGHRLVEQVSFPDHHPYSTVELQDLVQKAKSHDATLLTTEKDYVRLPRAFRHQIACLEVRMTSVSPDCLAQFVTEKLDIMKKSMPQDSTL